MDQHVVADHGIVQAFVPEQVVDLEVGCIPQRGGIDLRPVRGPRKTFLRPVVWGWAAPGRDR